MPGLLLAGHARTDGRGSCFRGLAGLLVHFTQTSDEEQTPSNPSRARDILRYIVTAITVTGDLRRFEARPHPSSRTADLRQVPKTALALLARHAGS